jgi:hypothetical protein
LTQHLQYAVGKEGTVICVNNSKKELTIISKRLKITKGPAFESMRGNVSMFHHPAYLTKLPDEITHADAVISLDTLSALSDPLPVLKQIAKILPEHAPICFFDYGDFFRLIPDQAWLGNDESIKELFFKAGFSVQVQRRSSLFWSYVFIHGIKSRSRIAVI